ncbi:MAG: hypothetical protein QM723_34710 [Myxococcaceae bacterium]
MFPTEDLHPDWRREVDQVLADVLVLSRRRLFISAAKRIGEARRYLEEHLRQAALLATLNALADAISSWDADRSCELAVQLRNELVTLP